MKKSIIITAGGIGKRMGANQPKQFLHLKGRPILMWTIERFFAYDPSMQIILALPEDFMDTWKDLCIKHSFTIQHELIAGGKERFHSVQNALKIAEGDFIGIHDAVRPFVDLHVIQNCFQLVIEHLAVVPVIDMKDSLRQLCGKHSVSVNRSQFKLVQTPQVFESQLLRKAYKLPFDESFTDDASVIEALGQRITLVNGNEENIKLTTPFDLKLAEVLLT
jgi:2-C-methyl-D-erythritol 4-phosphate cytidylyltransferase